MKLNVYKTFRRRPGHFINVLYTFNLRPLSRGVIASNISILSLFYKVYKRIIYGQYINVDISIKQKIFFFMTGSLDSEYHI